MKLAEALQERADLNRKIDELDRRIRQNVLVQQGEEPSEDPNAMFEELKRARDHLETVIRQINFSNCKHLVGGRSLTEIIARKDTLKMLYDAYRNALGAATQATSRARGTEIKILPVVDIKALRKESDEIAKEIRNLDSTLQQANWTFDLIEN